MLTARSYYGMRKNEQYSTRIPPELYHIRNLTVASVAFQKQPPDNLRKSNFFHFDLSFADSTGFVSSVEKAQFLGFIEESDEEKLLKNGIRYRLALRVSNGVVLEVKFVIRLVDSLSKRVISYDGQDKNPDMCRVLLTHEIMCSRCCENKSCGNRNETPSDPVIINNGKHIRLHMKCNQNCLKNAGNPRETRRFKVMVYLESPLGNTLTPMVCSENMFVHNNSKHGRRPGSSLDHLPHGPDGKCPPSVFQIIPKEGRAGGYEEIAVIGENFFEGIKIAFGNQLSVKTEFLSSSVLKVITPSFIGERQVEIKCVYASHLYQRGKFPIFTYSMPNRNSDLEIYFERVWSLLPKSSQETERPSDDIVLTRCADTFEFIYVSNMSMNGHHSHGSSSSTVPNTPSIGNNNNDIVGCGYSSSGNSALGVRNYPMSAISDGANAFMQDQCQPIRQMHYKQFKAPRKEPLVPCYSTRNVYQGISNHNGGIMDQCDSAVASSNSSGLSSIPNNVVMREGNLMYNSSIAPQQGYYSNLNIPRSEPSSGISDLSSQDNVNHRRMNGIGSNMLSGNISSGMPNPMGGNKYSLPSGHNGGSLSQLPCSYNKYDNTNVNFPTK